MTLGGMGGITAILIHSIVDFNLHIPANAILFSVLAALVMAPPPRLKRCLVPSIHTNIHRLPEMVHSQTQGGPKIFSVTK
jgi:hypothetical protein